MVGSVSCFFTKYADGTQHHPITFKNQNIQGGSHFQLYNVHPNLYENCSTIQRGSHANKTIFFFLSKKKNCP